MEPKVEAVRKNVTSSMKGSFLFEQNRLRNFTIPKRTPDKDFLTECSTNQRDYGDIKQRLSQGCLDTEYNLESLWRFDKIEMVHNKDLEEEFVAKRTKMREEGKQDKELSSFLVVSTEEVTQICQSGLRTSHSTKKELSIMKELGNPQLGVYLFRHIDIALNYASKHSICVENIIIFRVLLGKVKKIQPPKGKKKVALDPTPNFDCHMSRIQLSCKDSVEDQAIGSLVYFYEYNELSKPVDKPRQCLPYAVVKVKSVNLKMGDYSLVTSLKCRPKTFPKHEGRRRGLPLENCTRVTRIGKSQLIYEHFRKPEQDCAVNSNKRASSSADVSSVSGSKQNWQSPEAEIQGRKIKPKSARRWDSVLLEANEPSLQYTSGMEASRDVRSDCRGNCDKNDLKTHSGLSPVYVISSRLVKDPRLKKREPSMEEQNGEKLFDGISQCDNEQECNSEIETPAIMLPTRHRTPEGLFPCSDSTPEGIQKQHLQEITWEEEITLKGCVSPSSLHINEDCSVKAEQALASGSKVNEDILNPQKSHIDVQELEPTLESGFHRKMHLSENRRHLWTGDICASEWSLKDPSGAVHFEPTELQEGFSEKSSLAETPNKMNHQTHLTTKRGNLSGNAREEYTVKKMQENSIKERISDKDYVTCQSSETCRTTAVMRDFSEKSLSLSEPVSLHRNIIHDHKEYPLSLEMYVDVHETKNKTHDYGFNQIPKCQWKEGGLSVEKSKMYTCERQVPFAAEQKSGQQQEHGVNKSLKENVSDGCSLPETELVNHLSCKDNVPEIFVQDVDVKCTNPAQNETEIKLARCNESLTVSEQPRSQGEEFSDKADAEYQHLHGRMDWESLLRKPSPNVQVLGNPSLKKDAIECSYEKNAGTEEREATELLNISRWPDLHITITDIPQTKLSSLHSALRMKTEMGKCTTKYSRRNKGIPWSLEKKMGKCTQNSKLQNKKKGLTRRCSSEMFSFAQSEKHIKNVLNTLNIESLLCKNKHLSRKIDGAMFHLKKAQRSVQKSLKIAAKVGKKNLSNSLPRSHKILRHDFLESPAKKNAAASLPEGKIPNNKECNSVNVRKVKRTEPKAVFEKSPRLDSMKISDIKPTNDVLLMNKVENTSANITSENIPPILGKIKQDFSSETHRNPSKNSAKHLFSTTDEKKELVNSRIDQREDGSTFKSDVKMCVNKLATPDQTTVAPLAKINDLEQDENSRFSAVFKRLDDHFSHEKAALELPPAQEANASRLSASSNAFVPAEAPKQHHVSQFKPQMHGARSVSSNVFSNSSSNRHPEKNWSEKRIESCGGGAPKRQDIASSSKKKLVRSEHSCPDDLNTVAEHKYYMAENQKCKSLVKPVNHPESNTEGTSSSGYLPSSKSLVVDKTYAPLKPEKEIEITEPQRGFSTVEPCVKVVLKLQDRIRPRLVPLPNESACTQIPAGSADQGPGLPSKPSLKTVSGQAVGNRTSAAILPQAHSEISPSQTFVVACENRRDENHLPREQANNCKDITVSAVSLKVGIELKSLDLIVKLSEVLQEADATSSLARLHELVLACRRILPSFIKAFEEKQEDPFELVLVSREILERNLLLQAPHKLKSCAIEPLTELQIIMETMEFVENKRRCIEGKPTFRSLLWFDGSLCSELFGRQAGYQQQSNFYPAFQARLKYSALNELQNYHKQLIKVFKNTRWENHSYYSFLKSRREIQECEAAMKSPADFSAFFLSVPFVCGANYGDTVEELENSRKSVVDLINSYENLGGGVEKENHLWVIMEIIATKIGFIRSCEEVNLKVSLFGLEHLFFDAAKSLAWRSKVKGGKGQVHHLNEAALSKLCEIYEHMTEELASKNKSGAAEGHLQNQQAGESCDYEKVDRPREANEDPRLNVGEIIDEAQSANLEKLQQLVCRCTEHLEMLKKYFQILQDEDVSNILITKENVLGFMKSDGINAVILKPEAVEVYTEIAMLYETVFFLKNTIASKVDKPTFRSLLWFDFSLLHELVRCQENMASFSYRKDNLLNRIESAISEIEEELNVICECAENVNCSYALHLLSRELAELSATRNQLQASKNDVSMCVDLVPYTISLNYGSSVSDLEHNYHQFSLLLEKLMLADRKDLGKMAHIMKIMKTIEHMKFICTERGKSPLNLVIYQMLRNWRKSCQLRRLVNWKTHPNANRRHGSQHSSEWISSPPVSMSAAELGAHSPCRRRPVDVAAERSWAANEEKNKSSPSKKKRVVTSLMTAARKKHEKETSVLRKSARCSLPKGRDSPLKDSPCHEDVDETKARPFNVSPHSTDLKASPSASNPSLVNSSPFAGQQNLAALEMFIESSRSCCQTTKCHDQESFASCDMRHKNTSAALEKAQSPQKSSLSLAAKFGGGSSGLESDVRGNASNLPSEYKAVTNVSPQPDKCKGEGAAIPNSVPAYNLDSSGITERNKSMAPGCLHSETCSSVNNRNAAPWSAFGQHECVEQTPPMDILSGPAYTTGYPFYSCCVYQTGSDCHSVTQTYQQLNSYETHLLSPGMSTVASMVYNTQSSTFYSQSFSHLGVGESQRFYFAQTCPVNGYFSSVMFSPYTYPQPSWYAASHASVQVAFPYPSNISL